MGLTGKEEGKAENRKGEYTILFRREITMNCAFLVRSLIYDATMETCREPKKSENVKNHQIVVYRLCGCLIRKVSVDEYSRS